MKEKMEALERAIKFLEDRVSGKTTFGSIPQAVEEVRRKYVDVKEAVGQIPYAHKH